MAKGGRGGGGQASDAKELRLFLSHRMWREHRSVLLGALALALALLAALFLQFAGSDARMHRVQPADAALVARVFRSGEPWVVLCLRPDDTVPEAADELPQRLRGRVAVGVMDCTQPLAHTGGRSVLKAYGLSTRVTPTVFTVANGEPPRQVQQADLTSARALAKRVLAQTKKTLVQVRSSAQLASRCLARDACVLLLRSQRLEPYENQWLRALALRHRAVAFVWADAAQLKLSIEGSLPAVGAGEHRLVLFRRQETVGGGGNKGEKAEAQLTARAYRDVVFDAQPVGMFLDAALASDARLKPLARSPTLKSRQPTGRKPRRKASRKPSQPDDDTQDGVEEAADDQQDDQQGEQEDEQGEQVEVLDLDDD